MITNNAIDIFRIKEVTSGYPTTKQGQFLEMRGELGANLDNASRLKNGILTKRRRVEKVIDRLLPIFGPKPAPSITSHHFHQWVHSKYSAYVSLYTLATLARATLAVEYWHHMISFLQVRNPFSHALNNSALISRRIQTTLGVCIC